jgi:hypothetical protein
MEEKYEKLILAALRKNPGFNIEVYDRVRKDMSKDPYRKTRDRLVNDKKIVRKDIKRRAIFYLPEDESLYHTFIRERIPNYREKEFNEKLKNQLRKKHTIDIIKKVIDPWLDQIEGKHLVNHHMSGFSVKNDVLLSDFKHHIKFTPNPFDELEKFELQCKGYNNKLRQLSRDISRIICMEFEEYLNEFDQQDDKDIPELLNDEPNDRDNILNDLKTWLIGILFDWNSYYFDDAVFDYQYAHFDSSVKETQWNYEYYINVKDKNLFCGSIDKKNNGKSEFEQKMNNKIKKILKIIKEQKSLKEIASNLNEILNQMNNHLNNMRKSLKQHKELIILPNDCKYYPWII